jgi:Cu/Ag efflux protein CusF
MTTCVPRWIILALLAGTGSSLAFAQGVQHHGHGGHDAAHDHAHDHAHGDGASAGGELPKVEAEVRRVNTRANTLSVRHGDIPNLDMPPMTMTFQVQDPALLEGLEVGDSILVTIEKIDGAYTVMSVEPAP